MNRIVQVGYVIDTIRLSGFKHYSILLLSDTTVPDQNRQYIRLFHGKYYDGYGTNCYSAIPGIHDPIVLIEENGETCLYSFGKYTEHKLWKEIFHFVKNPYCCSRLDNPRLYIDDRPVNKCELSWIEYYSLKREMIKLRQDYDNLKEHGDNNILQEVLHYNIHEIVDRLSFRAKEFIQRVRCTDWHDDLVYRESVEYGAEVDDLDTYLRNYLKIGDTDTVLKELSVSDPYPDWRGEITLSDEDIAERKKKLIDNYSQAEHYAYNMRERWNELGNVEAILKRYHYVMELHDSFWPMKCITYGSEVSRLIWEFQHDCKSEELVSDMEKNLNDCWQLEINSPMLNRMKDELARRQIHEINLIR